MLLFLLPSSSTCLCTLCWGDAKATLLPFTADFLMAKFMFNPLMTVWKWRLEWQCSPAAQVWLGMRKGWVDAGQQSLIFPSCDF